MKLKICWEHRSENNDGHYGEDNPEADYPNEVYFQPTWTTRRYIEERDSSEIKKIFSEEDGDYDFSHTILFITDDKDRVLFATDRTENRRLSEEILIERLSQ